MNFLTKRYVNSKRNITAIVVIPQNRRNNNNRIYTNVMCKQKQHSPQMKKRCSDKNGFTFLGEIYRVRLLTFQQNILKIAVQTSCKPNYPTLNQTFQKVP